MADIADTAPSTAPSTVPASAQVFVRWEEDPQGYKASCTLAGKEPYSFVISRDASAASIDACVLGHYKLNSRTGCCEHDGNMPPSLCGMR